MNTLTRLWKDEEAANAVEYGLIAAVIAVALIGVLSQFGISIGNLFKRQKSAIDNT
jgi:pilus assembly protein Flp/PilA